MPQQLVVNGKSLCQPAQASCHEAIATKGLGQAQVEDTEGSHHLKVWEFTHDRADAELYPRGHM